MTVATSTSIAPLTSPSSVFRRKHTASTGVASEDCFACSKRGVKCDRRRPYCSQCLKNSSTCSGYKMQLTWGLGVASRGKLRGLSIPIAEPSYIARGPKKPRRRPRASRSASDSSIPVCGLAKRGDYQQMNRGRVFHTLSVSQPSVDLNMPYTGHDYDLLAISCPEPGQQCYRSNEQHLSYRSYVPHLATHHNEGSKHCSEFSVFPSRLIGSTFNLLGCPGAMSVNTSYHHEETPFPDKINDIYDSHKEEQPGLHFYQSSSASPMADTSRISPASSPGVVIVPPETSLSIGSQIDPLEDHFGYGMTYEYMSQHHLVPVAAYSL